MKLVVPLVVVLPFILSGASASNLDGETVTRVASANPIPTDVVGNAAGSKDNMALASGQLISKALAPEKEEGTGETPVAAEAATIEETAEAAAVSQPVFRGAAAPEKAVTAVESLPPIAESAPAEGEKFVQVQKPKLIDELKSLIMAFKPNQPAEHCDDVVTDMESNESTIQAARSMTVLLDRLDSDPEEDAGEQITTDKNCQNALVQLSSYMVDRDASNDGGGDNRDLITFMDRIVRCKANLGADRTILQQLVFMGLENSLKTSFVLDLLKGSSDYNSVDYLDAGGNNLLHLAVLSQAHHMPTALCSLIDKMNVQEHGASPAGIMTGAWWSLSALMHQNGNHLTPLSECRSPAMADELKRHFRGLTAYFRSKYKKAKALGSQDRSQLAKIDSMLKSAKLPGAADVGPHQF